MKSNKLWNIMLMIAFLIGASVSLSSCSKDDDELEIGKSYSVTINDMGISSLVTIDLTMFEYNDNNEKIGSQSWKSVKENETKSFTSVPNTTKVKIYLSMGSTKKWVQQVYYLNGKNTSIILNGSTMIGYSEP